MNAARQKRGAFRWLAESLALPATKTPQEPQIATSRSTHEGRQIVPTVTSGGLQKGRGAQCI
jgi:hypothetical protein